MLDYWVRLYRKYRTPIQQFIIFLQPTTSEAVYTQEFVVGRTRHGYDVVRMWQQNPTVFLNEPALLPLAPLAQTDSPQTLLEQVATQTARIESVEQRQNILASAQILAGLRYNQQLIAQLLREDIVKESVIYQDILQKGRQEGRQEGLLQGEAILILRQLTRRFGEVDSQLQQQIRSLSLPQLEALGEALLDFTNITDMTTCLEQIQEMN